MLGDIVVVVLLIAGLVTGFGFFVFLRRRRRTVFERAERRHKSDGVGQFLKQREQGFLNITYALAVGMVLADGKVEKVEMETAIRLGERLIANFDSVAFRRILLKHERLPRFHDVVDAVAPLLPLEVKIEIFQYLQAIATSDGRISPDEKHFIHHAEMQFKLDHLVEV